MKPKLKKNSKKNSKMCYRSISRDPHLLLLLKVVLRKQSLINAAQHIRKKIARSYDG